MREVFRRVLSLVKRVYLGCAAKTSRTQNEITVRKWFADNGDKTLRLDYDIRENSVVFDLGGFAGQWTSDIFAKYCCSVHVFEPVRGFARDITHRFRKNPKIQVHQFGLGNRTFKTTISLAGDGSTICLKQGPALRLELEEVDIVRFGDFLRDHNITRIDLMKVNIEGGEYDLLDYLLETGLIHNIVNLQVQFHDFVPNAAQRMAAIQARLSKTHSLTYQYLFVWENWQLNESPRE